MSDQRRGYYALDSNRKRNKRDLKDRPPFMELINRLNINIDDYKSGFHVIANIVRKLPLCQDCKGSFNKKKTSRIGITDYGGVVRHCIGHHINFPNGWIEIMMRDSDQRWHIKSDWSEIDLLVMFRLTESPYD